MKVDHKWLTGAEIEKSKEQTRKARDRPLRHHVVPQMYLRRWALDDGSKSKLILRTDIDTHESEPRNPDSVAHHPDFYRIEGDGIDPHQVPDLWFEIHMSRIENDATYWLMNLSDLPDGRITDRDRIIDLAVFIGLQSQRTVRRRQGELDIDAGIQRFGHHDVFSTPELLPTLCAQTGRIYDPNRHDELADEIAADALSNPVISAAPDASQARAIESAIGGWRNTFVPHLAFQRTWWLISTASPLSTCDEPLIYLGSKRGRHSPQSYRFGDAPLLVFPIGPHRLLALAFHPVCQPTPPFTLTDADTDALNFEIAAACLQYVFERIGSNIAVNINVPPRVEFDPSTAQTFWESVNPPTRWSARQGPPWALQRWTTTV